jgi:acetylornithine aminotransferase
VRGIAGVTAVRGRGLMIGIDTVVPSNVVRAHLVRHHRMLTGNASTPNTVRVLPALTIDDALLRQFVEALTHTLAELTL